MSDLKTAWLAAEHEAEVAYESAERAREVYERTREIWKEKSAEARRLFHAYKESEKGRTL